MPEPTDRIALKQPTKSEPIGSPVTRWVKHSDLTGRTWYELDTDATRTPGVANS